MNSETCKREIVIEIPIDVIAKESDVVVTQFQRVARIPGFRKGHAPATLIRRHFKNDIRSELVQNLLPKFFDDVVREKHLQVVGQPRFEDLKFEDGQPLTCKASFEVAPEFELGEYKGLEIEVESAQVSEEDVDKALEELRQSAATYEDVQGRPAEDDDYVMVSYQGHDAKDAGGEPVQSRSAVVHLGAPGTVAAFTENLRGASPGEKREFDVEYPADYPQKSLAGRAIHYAVSVESINRKVLPPPDDELAKSAGDSETLADLRIKLKEGLEKRKARQVENQAMAKLLAQIESRHSFPVPEVLIEAQLDRKLESFVTQLMSQGIDPRTTQVDWRKIREEARPDAEKEVRGSMLLERIATAEDLEVTEEEVDDLIREMAEERREPAAALKTRLTREGALDRIKSTRRNHKALELVYREAKITGKS
ncbi:MAG: trigger factor [Acidobacteria bacterium]|nr:trigger factor [Acidobacteriota bacterium]